MIALTPLPPSLDWNLAALHAALAPLLPNIEMQVMASVGSTNSVLLDALRFADSTDAPAAAGAFGAAESAGEVREADSTEDSPMPVQRRRSVESRAFHRRAPDRAPRLLVAEHQTAGRGRQGRAWHAAVGASLTFSLAVPIRRADLSGLSLAIGVALVEALDPVPSFATTAQPDITAASKPDDGETTWRRFGPPHPSGRIGLKWPNDLWLVGADGPAGARKLGGILIETVSALGQRWAVIGVGLNVREVDAPGATTGVAALSEIDAEASAPRALERIATPLAEAIATFEREGYPAFAARFSDRDLLQDQPVTTTSPDTPDGIARGVDDDGALRVEVAGGLRLLYGGEVSVRPVAAAAGRAC